MLQSLAKETSIELAVNSTGRAMLVHKGPLHHNYSSIQYDPLTATVQMITEEGDVQELGIVIPEKMKPLLDNTREIAVIELSDDTWDIKHRFIVFNKVVT